MIKKKCGLLRTSHLQQSVEKLAKVCLKISLLTVVPYHCR